MAVLVAQGFWAGIDVASDKFDVALAPLPADPKNWMRFKCQTFPLTESGVKKFIAWLAREEGTCEGLCAESTGIYSQRLQDLLEEHSSLPRLSIENPARIKGTARMLAAPGKTDEIDARVIAFYAVTNRPEPKEPLSKGQRRLREATKLRDSLVDQQTALKNQYESLSDPKTRKIMLAILKSVKKQLEAAEKLVSEVIEEDEQLSQDAKLLRSVPCIGAQVAAAILGLFGDLRKWKRREIISRAGLVPLPYESGKTVRGRPHLSKRGGAKLRAKLYMPGMRLLKTDYGFNARVKERFERKENGKVCICAGMRKTLLVARAVVISGEPFDKARARRCAPAVMETTMEGRSGG